MQQTQPASAVKKCSNSIMKCHTEDMGKLGAHVKQASMATRDP